MRATSVLRIAARTPLIKFIGKHTVPASVDHTPRVHPASPNGTLPDSFVTYRAKAQQHGPLGLAAVGHGFIGGRPGAALGPVEPKAGEFFDRDDLPPRFHRLAWSEAEIEAIETGGASLFN